MVRTPIGMAGRTPCRFAAMPAPTASDGAKMPPGMPLIDERIVATNFSGPNVQGSCEVPCRMDLAWS